MAIACGSTWMLSTGSPAAPSLRPRNGIERYASLSAGTRSASRDPAARVAGSILAGPQQDQVGLLAGSDLKLRVRPERREGRSARSGGRRVMDFDARRHI